VVERGSPSFEKRLQVGNSPVVDVFVGGSESPFLGILRKMFFDIFEKLLLDVHT